MHFTNVFIAAIAACNALATPIARSPYSIKETHFVPDEWSKQERTNAQNTVQLQIGLKQGRFDELDRHLQEVSDPDGQRYGQYLTAEEHADGRIASRTTRWSLPRHLHEHIDTIQPTTSFFRGAPHTWFHTTAQSSSPPTNSSHTAVCDRESVTPECFQTLYGTKGYKTQASSRNSIGFTNYLGQIPIRPDTKIFLEKYRPEAVSQASAFTQLSVAGGPVQDGPLTANQTSSFISLEANLNVQTISGLAWEMPITSYSTGGRAPFIPASPDEENNNEPFLVWLDYLAQQKDIPKVISTSYGEPEQTVPRVYAERVCRQFAQVGARGTSLFFAAGNSGVGPDGKCFTNDGTKAKQFVSYFPTACPYVTSVGATMGFAPEEVAYRSLSNGTSYFTPGGGFSNYFARPAWQDGTVPKYVKALEEKYKGLYNASGRGYPDIVAQGVNFAYVWSGIDTVASGTSAAAPLAASVFALVNDALIAAGKPTLGFLNPWLYKKGHKALNDITKGNNRGCDTEGFAAGKGWDPASGFGSPNFPKLVKLAMGEDY
ncbi:hypothetical protein PTNB73_08864 [Pyrenophora teres f. teres]|nr:hypothetical protein PTNB85_10419 [Pyrenophora teres f. teres]KAE8825126.1 hypothetical protein HRS9122_10225 [Pyrenophora teres f. teres]KAE8857616.1 hypothetical protein PTNB73_08864 [Pyrenophora teres f. teres]